MTLQIIQEGRNKNNPTKFPRQGVVQFVIKIATPESQFKTFFVYQADSSEDSARKLVTNLGLRDDLIIPFANYIEERR